MKYGNIIFDGDRKTSVNIGDDMQLLAVEYLYDLMNIPQQDRVRVPLSKLSTYVHPNNEYVILPISFPLYGYRSDMYITMFSPAIIPVFIGLSIMSSSIEDKEIDYPKRFEPIGCRDAHTMNILRSYNISAYLNGCLTAIFPKKNDALGDKIFLVDVPNKFLQYIPNEIKEKAIVTSQVLDDTDNPEKSAMQQYEQYKKEAKLIITTRLHCAWPCLAAGIPVILLKENFSFRFTALEKLLHQYTISEFSTIDWTGKSIDYENIKRYIIENAKFQINNVIEKNKTWIKISEFYESSIQTKSCFIEHFDNVVQDIISKWNVYADIRYAFWGLTQKTEMIYSYITKNFPNAKCVAVYDRDKNVDFFGIKTTQDINLLIDDEVFVFITAATANAYAKKVFNANNKHNFYISSDGFGE